MLRSAFPTCTAKHKNYTGRHSLCLQSDSRFVRLLNSGRPAPRARPLRGSGARGANRGQYLYSVLFNDPATTVPRLPLDNDADATFLAAT